MTFLLLVPMCRTQCSVLLILKAIKEWERKNSSIFFFFYLALINLINIRNGFVLSRQVDHVRRWVLPALLQPPIRNKCSLQAVLGVKPKVREALTTVKCVSCVEDSEKQSAQSS